MNSNIMQSDSIITIGTRIATENQKIQSDIYKMIDDKKCDFIYMHPIDDVGLHNKYTQYIKYEAGSEEGVLALLAFFLITDAPLECKEYLEDLDIGCLSGESSVGEEELELLVETLCDKKEITLLIGDDITTHKQFDNIASLLRLIDLYTHINVILLNTAIEIDLTQKIIPDDISDIHTYNGTVIYTAYDEEDILRGSSSFAMAAKIQDNDMITLSYENFSITKKFMLDTVIRGTIALYPLLSSPHKNPITSGYRFKQVKIQRVTPS